MPTDKLTIEFERQVKGWSAHLVGTAYWGKGWTVQEAFDRLLHELLMATVEQVAAPRGRKGRP